MSEDDDGTAIPTPQVVEEVFTREGQLFEVEIGGRVLRTTPEHPFFVQGQGWTAAGELQPGDLVSSATGEWLPVQSITDTHQSVTVYNFRVSEYHTYFIAPSDLAFDVWVHNAYKVNSEVARKLFPSSSQIEYGTGLSAIAHQRRLGGGVFNGHNLAVYEYVHDGVTKQKLFKNIINRDHSEDVAIRWFNRQGIDRSSISKVYSEFHPCTSCDPLTRATFPNAQIEYSWFYRTSSRTDYVTNIGRDMKRAALLDL